MKSLLLTALTASILCGNSFGQKQVNEVKLTYKISVESSNLKQSTAKSFDGATFTVYVKGNESKTVMQSSLGSEANIFNSKTGKGYILKEYSGQKLMITLNRNNWSQKNQLFQSYKFKIDGDGEEVAGLKSKKAVATTEDGKSFVVYFTPEIVSVNKEYNNAFTSLPGIPVEYELESAGLKFKYTLAEINYDNLPASLFEIPKAGFRVMSYDENQQLKKGN